MTGTAARTAVITGATTGLGFECARALLGIDPSWRLVLPARSAARRTDVVAALGADRATVFEMDLASLDSVRAFTETFRNAGLPPLRAIVCNAGLQSSTATSVTADGFETTFGVNHLGHFTLVQGLLDVLSAPARIVVTSSGTHDPAKHTGMPSPRYTDAETLSRPATVGSSTEGRRRYTTSKLCNVLFAYELDRRLGCGDQGITVTAFDPGLMPGSGLVRDYPPAQRWAWRYLFPALRVLPNVNSMKTSGRRLAALVGSPVFDGVTGAYFEGKSQIMSSADSYDRDKALDLWRTTERLTSAAKGDPRPR